MSAHTPAPWEARGPMIYGAGVGGVVVAQALGGVGASWPTIDANVRLIAAAPELLDACRELVVAVSAAMRVIADLDAVAAVLGQPATRVSADFDAMKVVGAEAATREQRFVNELKIAGVRNGFGVRANAAIAKAER